MRGVLLAGGKGTRLGECTRVTNKHLLAVYDKPMIYYPLQTLQQAGIQDVLIVTGGEHIGKIAELLQDGRDFGVNLTYRVQQEAGGISQALGLAERFAHGEPLAVILGDNYFEDDFRKDAEDFQGGARIFLKKTAHPERYGVVQVNDDYPGRGFRIKKIVEKPQHFISPYAVTGFYLYRENVFDVIRTLKPSSRGELEITDVNNHFIQEDSMQHSLVKGYWGDMGEPDSLLETAQHIAQKKRDS